MGGSAEQLFTDEQGKDVFGDAGRKQYPISLRNGVLPEDGIRALMASRELLASPRIDDNQIQPASLDLRLGKFAYRVRASFLPGPDAAVEERLEDLRLHRVDISEGAVLETQCVYVVPLLEYLSLRSSIVATANPKSSTGRLDVFTRLITDRCTAFDTVPAEYKG